MFDIGTSGGKSAVVDERGQILALRKEEWSTRKTPGLEDYGSEFDANEVERKLLSAASLVLRESKVEPADLRGITATSLRFGYVFLDQGDNPLYFGSNMDGRGFFEQDVVEERLGDTVYEVTGLYPPMLFGLSKLLWFRDNTPEKFRRISKVMNLNDWWIYRLSGEFCTDHSSASTTGLYDIGRWQWSDDILSAFGLNPSMLPAIVNAGSRVGSLKEGLRLALGLGNPDIIVGGPDTQCGLLGAGCMSEHEIGVVAGATAPCQMISSARPSLQSKRVLVGGYLVPKKYVLESNAGQCGLCYDWAVRTFVGPGAEAYSSAEEKVFATGPGPTGMTSLVGSQIMNLDQLHLMKPSMTVFPSPVVPPFFRADAGAFLKAVLEEVCCAISCNMDTLEALSGEVQGHFRVTGGLTRSKFFCKLLGNVTAKRVQVSSEVNGTILGAALSAMVGSGTYRSYEEAVRETVHTSTIAEPDASVLRDYAETKRRWKELYLQTTRLTEEGIL